VHRTLVRGRGVMVMVTLSVGGTSDKPSNRHLGLPDLYDPLELDEVPVGNPPGCGQSPNPAVPDSRTLGATIAW
jgi:hypothetical protein